MEEEQGEDSEVLDAMDGWDYDYILLSDSVIAICWVLSEDKRLSIFHRNRCNQVRMHTDVKKIMHVRSEYNPSDTGSRPDKVQDEDVGPDSAWEKGLPWMRESIEKAIDNEILKPGTEIKLVGSEEDDFDKGCIIEKDIDVIVKGSHSSVYFHRGDAGIVRCLGHTKTRRR